MSPLILTTLKVVFLLLLWVFILGATQVIRGDLVGREVAAGEPSLAGGGTRGHRRRSARGAPGTLTVLEGSRAGVSIPMAGVVGIGRADDSALQIGDDYASTRHAQLWQDDSGHWQVEDLQSTNGTYLNNARIDQPQRVRVGDTIRIGRTIMRLEK